MSFNEWSAWIMSALLIVASIVFGNALSSAGHAGLFASSESEILTVAAALGITMLAMVAIAATIAHIVLGILMHRSIPDRDDEMERNIERTASAVAFAVVQTLLLASLAALFFGLRPVMLVYAIIAVSLAGYLVANLTQIFLYRRIAWA